MRKSCKDCGGYKASQKYCMYFDMNITYTSNATYCKKYKLAKVSKDNVKCKYCRNINKYNWCIARRECVSEEKLESKRKCCHFEKRVNNNRIKKRY